MTPLPSIQPDSIPAADAFDALAPDYDTLWTHSPVGRLQRSEVLRELNRVFGPGDRVLELGCGTGEDALRLVREGIRVHATDASPAMLRVARDKLQGAAARASFELRPMEALAGLVDRGPYDGAFSDFGAVNCVRDLRAAGEALAAVMKPGARLVLCFMGRFCLWETCWHLLRGRPATGMRRLRGTVARIASLRPGKPARGSGSEEGVRLTVFYPTIAQLAADLQPSFDLESVRGVGVFVPPSYLDARVAGKPRLLRVLASLDGWLGGWIGVRAIGDHRLATFRRKGAEGGAPVRRDGAGPDLRCPACRNPEEPLDPSSRRCGSCGLEIREREGILRALPPSRAEAYRRFRREYGAVRAAEGRGSDNPDFYRALPYRDLTGRNSGQWAIRARTWRYFVRRILRPLEGSRSLAVLDLGAGNGWLSYRLSQRGHSPVAVDILDDAVDGLGAARHLFPALARPFACVEAEFDHLPFADAQFDLAVFNASFHYSTDYRRTLAEVRRCLRASGTVAILDSPIYRRAAHGDVMREERHRDFERRFGFRSDSVASREYLHDAELAELAGALGLEWRVHRPWYGLRWHLRPWQARLRGGRPPSRFNILVGRWPQ